MTRLNCALHFLFSFTILDGYPGVAQSSRTTWLTCSLTEGKGDSCSRGDEARPFEQFLTPGPWGNTLGDSFSGDFQFDLKQPETKWRVTWSEVGKLSSHRIRQVRYLTGESSFAALVLAEISTGVFAPLMKWSGQMPDPIVLTVGGTDVLHMRKDWGGNIPMVQTWTWIWN